MIYYKESDGEVKSRESELQHTYFLSEKDNYLQQMIAKFYIPNIEFYENEYTTIICYIYSIMQDYILPLNEIFIDKLMSLLLEKRLSKENTDFSLKLISKMINYDTEMIESLLHHGFLKLIYSIFPSKYGLKFCTKLAKHREEYQKLFLEKQTLFYEIHNNNQDDENYENEEDEEDRMDFELNEVDKEKFIINIDSIKLYAKFFSSLVTKICDLPPYYFNFCHYLVTKLGTDSSTRYAIITALLTLVQASSDYIDEMIERNTFFFLRDTIKGNEELADESDEIVSELKKKNIYMEDIEKREIRSILEIFITLTNDRSNNYSDFLIENDFIDWLYCFYCQNKEFHQRDRKTMLCPYLTFLGDLALYNQNIFSHPLYLEQIYEILGKFEEYHFQIKMALFRLLFILFDSAPTEIFQELIENNVHMIFLDHITYTDLSDRLIVLNSCYRIFTCCPNDIFYDLCQYAQDNEELMGFLTDDQPEFDDSQRVADLILEQIHKIDEE